ncbi:hypothetical protein BJ981_003235 [Sphaerisporangium krabiense]|uniref:Pyridoxamine 5'-phosphate oxidase family protein n=1 Tax=Sphaerisporangium krabiense TaxID=763782 RepID=A0A7W8Z515_9ACTN|nr:hypothetical protein [Sphaerisporangium krabiense]
MSLSLIEEAAKKSGVLWISLPAGDRLAWHVWHDGAVYVVTGGGEQALPGLVDAARVTVTLRSKDNGARLVAFEAAVRVVDQSSPSEGDAGAIAALAKERLNAPDAAGLTSRWAAGSSVVRLTPEVAV